MKRYTVFQNFFRIFRGHENKLGDMVLVDLQKSKSWVIGHRWLLTLYKILQICYHGHINSNSSCQCFPLPCGHMVCLVLNCSLFCLPGRREGWFKYPENLFMTHLAFSFQNPQPKLDHTRMMSLKPSGGWSWGWEEGSLEPSKCLPAFRYFNLLVVDVYSQMWLN